MKFLAVTLLTISAAGILLCSKPANKETAGQTAPKVSQGREDAASKKSAAVKPIAFVADEEYTVKTAASLQTIYNGKSVLPTDSLSSRGRYVVISQTTLFETPSRFACFNETYDPASRSLNKGSFVWDVAGEYPDTKSPFIPVYVFKYGEGVKMYWVQRTALRRYKNVSSVNDIISPETVDWIALGAIASNDSALVAWILNREKRLNFTGYMDFLLKQLSNNKEVYTHLRPYFTPDPNSFSDERFDSLYWDCYFGDIKAIKQYIANPETNWKKIYGRHNMPLHKNAEQNMFNYLAWITHSSDRAVHSFGALMTMANPKLVHGLNRFEIEYCLAASLFHPDKKLLHKFMKMCDKPVLDTVLARMMHRYEYNPPINKVIIDEGDRIFGKNSDRRNVHGMRNAIRACDSLLCAQMLEKGVRLDDTSLFSGTATPIAAACAMQFRDKRPVTDDQVLAVVRLLKEHGVNVDGEFWLSYKSRVSALYLAARNGLPKVASYLISQGAILDKTYKVSYAGLSDSCNDNVCQNETPLHAAIRLGHRDVVRILVEKGAKTEGAEYSTLAAACHANNLSWFREQCEKGMDVDSTHLVIAAWCGSDSIVGYLLKNHPALNRVYQVQIGGTSCVASALSLALFGAVYKDRAGYWNDRGSYEKTVTMLLDAGCSVNDTATIRSERLLPVEIAAGARRFDLVNMLLERGAVVTPLVLRDAMTLTDPSVVTMYIPPFLQTNQPLFMLEYCGNQLERALYYGAIDSAAFGKIKNYYRQQAAFEVRRIRADAAARIAAATPDTTDSARCIQVAMDSLRSFESYGNDGIFIGEEYYAGMIRENATAIKFSPTILGLPVTLASSSPLCEATSAKNPPEWFTQYNPHLVDMLTKLLDHPEVTALFTTLGDRLPFRQEMCREAARVPAFAHAMLSVHRQMMAQGGDSMAIARYDAYFRDPFGKNINNSFSDFEQPYAASFWARRVLDGSADSFLRLFTRIAQLFPGYAIDNDESDEFDESEEGGDGEYGGHRNSSEGEE